MAKRGAKLGKRQRRVYPTDDTKVCTLCGKTKPLGEFYERKSQPVEGGVTTHYGNCIPCNKRVSAHRYWKKSLVKDGEAPILAHLETLRFQLREAEEILRRHRAGEDVLNWLAEGGDE